MKLALALIFFATLNAQSLTIGGDVAKPLTLIRDDLAKLPRTSVTLNDHGKETSYEGVLLYDILKQAGAPLSETQGPFRLVVPREKKPARSIRMLEKITVVRLRK